MKILASLILFCLSLTLYCQESSPIVRFSPGDYNAANQNWAFTQNSKGYIFVANNEGLLEFNGADWKLSPSPNNTIMRSLCAEKDRIYSGAYMEFGYWERNSKGRFIYTSLSSRIGKELIEDENIWNIKVLDDWVVFQSEDRLYFYNSTTQEIHYNDDKNNNRRIYKLNNHIYIHKREGNISIIDGGEERVITEFGKNLNFNLILNIFSNNEGFTLLTRNHGFFKVKDGITTKWQSSIDGLLGNIQIFSGIQLKDKSFVLGTISNGILHLSPEGELINTINQSNGLSNNTILNLLEDRSGNVWVALDNGIDCLNMQSFIREYNDNGGDFGTTYCSMVYNATLYVGTNQGLFYKPAMANVPLKLVGGTKGQVWSLYAYGGDLLCGHTSGVFIIQDGQSEKVSDNPGVWSFRSIPDDPELLLIGHYSGMSILEKKNKRWGLRNNIEGFETSARFFEITAGDEVWVNHEYKGVYRLRLNNTYTSFEEVSLLDYIPKGKGSALAKVDGVLLYSYEDGIFRIDHTEQKISRDTALRKLIEKSEYVSGKLVFDDMNRLWAFNKSCIKYAEKGPVPGNNSIKSIPITNHWRKTTVSFENITHLQDNRYIIGKTNGYILVDLNQIKTEQHTVFLNDIHVWQKDTVKEVDLNEDGHFKYKEGNIRFNVSVPWFHKYELIEYQYRLKGYQDRWSDWTSASEISYEKLPFGTYRFQLRSKIGNQLSDNTISYDFTISRPSYFSNLAIGGYVLMLFLVIIIIHGLYKNYYKKLHEELIRENQRRYDLNKIQNEQEVVKLRNEKLRDEIEAKNRELAISTMSIIKRNEFLRGIRKELKKNTTLAENHPVYKLIEKNLNSSKDWDFFRDAFNNADKDFLKRAKELHPNLTHNDLKFCAYLRLNLSSKEIAPLLNISTKSVEVRRYRLRKKMNLAHEKNLTDYILGM